MPRILLAEEDLFIKKFQLVVQGHFVSISKLSQKNSIFCSLERKFGKTAYRPNSNIPLVEECDEWIRKKCNSMWIHCFEGKN